MHLVDRYSKFPAARLTSLLELTAYRVSRARVGTSERAEAQARFDMLVQALRAQEGK